VKYHQLTLNELASHRGSTSVATSAPFNPPAETVHIVTIRPDDTADAMGVLIRAEPLQRTCEQLGLCQGDGRCDGCDPVEPASTKATPMQQFRHAIVIAALAGTSTGIVLGALLWAAEWVGS
jgi:hypothetical protein